LTAAADRGIDIGFSKDSRGLSAGIGGIQPVRIMTMQRNVRDVRSATARARAAALACALLAAAAAGSLPAEGAARDAALRDSLVASIRKDRADTETWLKSSSTSYLAAVRRMDFDDRRALTIGSAPGNDLRLEDSSLAAHHLRVT